MGKKNRRGYQIQSSVNVSGGEKTRRGDGHMKLDKVKLLLGKVTGVVSSTKSPLYSGAPGLGGVYFTHIDNNTTHNDVVNNVNKGKNTGKLAYPLSSNLTSLPLLNEIVLIIPNNAPTDTRAPLYFYLSALNLFNTGVYNPNSSEIDIIGENGELNLGYGLSEEIIGKINKLLVSPGDFLLEGRFGNTIRLGNSNGETTPWVQPNNDINSPITIIRNGQRTTDNKNPIFEDINLDNSSIYLTKGQTIPINVISPDLETFELKEEEVTYEAPTFNLSVEDIDSADSKAAIISAQEEEQTSPTEEFDAHGDVGVEDTGPVEKLLSYLSDEAFVPEGSDGQMGLESSTTTPPPPTSPPAIPEDADVYFLEDGTYITFEILGPKKTPVATKDGVEVYRGATSFTDDNKILAEVVALNLNSPLYGIEDPNPNSTAPTDPSGGEDPNAPMLLVECNTEDGAYKIYKDNVEYYANDPGGSRFTGGYSIDSHDDNTAIELIKEEINDKYE